MSNPSYHLFQTPTKPARPRPRLSASPEVKRGHYPWQKHAKAASKYSVADLYDEFELTPGEWNDARTQVAILSCKLTFRSPPSVIKLLREKSKKFTVKKGAQ